MQLLASLHVPSSLRMFCSFMGGRCQCFAQMYDHPALAAQATPSALDYLTRLNPYQDRSHRKRKLAGSAFCSWRKSHAKISQEASGGSSIGSRLDLCCVQSCKFQCFDVQGNVCSSGTRLQAQRHWHLTSWTQCLTDVPGFGSFLQKVFENSITWSIYGTSWIYVSWLRKAIYIQSWLCLSCTRNWTIDISNSTTTGPSVAKL